MKKRFLALVAAAALVATTTGVAGAAQQVGQSLEVQGAFVDVDGNGLDDALDEALLDANPNDRVAVLVTMTPGGTERALRRAAGQFDTGRRFTIVRGFEASMTVGQIEGLARNPNVRRIEPDSKVFATIEGTTTEFGTDRARATYGVDGTGVTACISDSGVDITHEQLDNGKVVGFIDYVGTQTTSYDDFGHGTHVASILAGDGVGSPAAAAHAGVAPGASILAAKTLDANGSGDTADVVTSIQWCVDQGADIISLSLGAPESADGSDAMSQAVDSAVLNHNVPVVVAAGNSGDGAGSINAPGAAAEAITVGAVAESVGTPGTASRSFGIHLAGFSSRGPTAANVLKPDLVAPGVSISAADANVQAGYTVLSGTSMATPFVAGTLALALERNSSLTPTSLKSLLTSTAQDRGVPGPDDNWGAGLLDGWAAVSAAGNDVVSPTVFPRNENGTGSVTPGEVWSHEFTLGPDDMTTPIGITLLIDGQAVCTLFCLSMEWDPDLDSHLVDPNDNVIDDSLCPSQPHCGTFLVTQGQQETLNVMPTVPGAYRLEVWAVAEGGSFTFDISAGEGGTTPPPTNDDPVADAGPDQSVPDLRKKGSEPVTLDGSGSHDDDGTIESWTWSIGGSVIATGETANVTLPVGINVVTLEVVDDDGASDTDTVVVAVGVVDQPPVADAGPDQPSVPDTGVLGSEEVTLDGSGSSDDIGIVSYSWRENNSEIATGETANVTLPVGSHTITLVVTDTAGNTDSDTVVIAIDGPPGFPMHVHDLDVTAATAGKNRWTATIDVFVVGTDVENDPNFPLVLGVDPSTVTFSLSSGGTVSCTTGLGPDGRCSVTTPELGKRVKDLTLTVVSVSTPGFTYEASGNHDDDGDSDGTSITISRP